MQAEKFQRVMQIVGEALEHGPDSREVWVKSSCAGDETLRGEVSRLLAQQTAAVEFLEESPVIAAAAESDRQSFIGDRFGPYRIISEIARGGMGTVYLGQRDDQEFTKQVAIKIIKRGMDTDFVLQRFRNERQILAGLDHPHIARLIDGGTTNDLPYFVMEYVDGVPITKFCNAHQLGTNDRLRLFRTVCSTVQYAHQNLVIHRDLKPSNILVTKDGEPKLLDFGIAKLLQAETSEETAFTQTGLRVMTPEYASPEQVKGERVTTSSDVYSLGVLLYELLTGQRPYRVKSRAPEEIVKAICEQEPSRPSQVVRGQRSGGSGKEQRAKSQEKTGQQLTTDDGQLTNQKSAIGNRQLRGDLDNIILKALRKEPERRYASVEQFSEDIRRHLEGLPVTARKDTFAYRASKFVQRNKISTAAAAIIFVTLVGGIVAIAWEARKARIEKARAELRFNETRALTHKVLFEYNDSIAALPGSTGMREKLVKDALQYLDELSDDEGNSPALQRELAAAYLKVGDVQGKPYSPNLGHTDEALASYQKALKILQSLSPNTSTDPELKDELATIYERIGNIQRRKGDFNEAFDKNSQALQIRQNLLASDQNNPTLRREVADSYIYVGDTLEAKCAVEVQCVRDALSDQQRALEIRQAQAAENPNDFDLKRAVAQAHIRIGFRMSALASLTKEKDYVRQWLEHDRAALAITRELAAANRLNAIDRRNLADQLMLTANAQLENGDTAGALSGYNESLEIFKALAAADTSNSEAQRDLSFVYYRLGALFAQTGKSASARERYAHALEITQQLLAQNPSDSEDLSTAIGVYQALSKLAQDSGDLDGAIDYRKHEIEIRTRVVAGDPNSVDYSENLASAYELLGHLYAKKGGAHFSSGGVLDVNVPKRINARQAENWREAKTAYQTALGIYEDSRSKGKLQPIPNYVEGMRFYIDTCDSFLARAPK